LSLRSWGAIAGGQGGGDHQGATCGGERGDHHAEGGGEGCDRAHDSGKDALAATLLSLSQDERHDACRKADRSHRGWAGLERGDDSLEGLGLSRARRAAGQVRLNSRRKL
jgi:hypothetical protein